MKKQEWLFLKYLVVAFLSFLIDLTFFTFFNTYLSISEFFSTILARCISSPCNFLMNKDKVFVSVVNSHKAFLKYLLLVVCQMFISGILVETICDFVTFNPVFIKIPIELILFISNYLIQKIMIFKK